MPVPGGPTVIDTLDATPGSTTEAGLMGFAELLYRGRLARYTVEVILVMQYY